MTANPPLVGREPEIKSMTELLHALGDGGGGSVLQVAGEPGIGKSRLLRELAAEADGRGHLVLSGRAADFDAELPFGLFNGALDDWLLRSGRKRLEALAGGMAADLAVVLHAFEPLASGRGVRMQQERYRAYRAVRWLLSTLGAERPLVLVLDDLQWADPGSVELLCHLLARPPGGAVLLALGFRPAQLPPRLIAAMASAEREQPGRRLDLAPLPEPAVRELLGPAVPAPARVRMYRESGGNPFFLLQLARRASLASPRPVEGAPGTSAVPEPVLAALATELSSLSAPALVLLQGAAVTGDPFEAALAASAADIGPDDALDLVDELLQFQLVSPTSVAGEYAFRHPIVRATVSQLAANAWKTRAHARLAHLLARRGASSAALAPHVERSATGGDMAAVGVLVEAGHSTASGSPAIAARWYRAALDLLPDGAETAACRIELMVALATALAGAGQLEGSRGVLVEVLALLPAGHPASATVVTFCAGVEHLLGRHREAETRLLRALRAVLDAASVDATGLMVELAAGAAYQNRYGEMLHWAERAFAGATDASARALAVAAGGQIALAKYFLGAPAGEAIDRAAAAMDDLDDAELAGRLDIGLYVGWTEAVLERNERAIEHCRRVISVSRSTGQGAALVVTMTAQAWSLIRLGRLAEAEELLTGAIEAGYLAPNLFLSVAVGLAAVVATHRGDYDVALRWGAESVRLAREADPGLIPGMSGLYDAIPLLETGDARQARDVLLAMSRGVPELETSRSGHAVSYEVLTRAALALDDMEAAEEWAQRAEAATHGGDLAAEAAAAARARAAVALARGDAAEAANLMVAAATRCDRVSAPVEAARCRILAGRALARAGQRDKAVAELERAARDLGGVGAYGYGADADRELRRLGRRVARRPGGASSALTEREREIAQLVAQGHTNRQIAASTYVSEKTVERHLSRIYVKLGVSSRTALALLMTTHPQM